ncbi:MAG: helix-turn-helix domain-containing protein [Tardiphaga sp.]
MAVQDLPTEVAIVLYPGAAPATVHGLTDLFAVASTVSRQNGAAAALRVSHWQPKAACDDVECVFDTHAERTNAPAAVIVPGSWQGEPPSDVIACLVQWLGRRHAAGSTLCSVCGGAFILAQSGLLAGRAVTTHWSFTQALAERFPDLQVDEKRITIEDGNFITAGGVLAWTDLGLKLVDRYLGSAVMLETARYMLADPPGREQRYYSSFSPRLNHGDAAVLKVQNWLQTRSAIQPSIAQMAAVSRLQERTFLRRFEKATGLKPTEYCQRLKVGKAREILECSSQSISEIAWAVGYQDPGSFRRIFRKVVGLSPAEYRQRFALGRSPPNPAAS